MADGTLYPSESKPLGHGARFQAYKAELAAHAVRHVELRERRARGEVDDSDYHQGAEPTSEG
jgi:hypothetical protein